MLCFAIGLVSHQDILIADFESPTYEQWRVDGKAFGAGPAQGTLPNQMSVTGFKGHGLANSFVGGDDSTGVLTSPSFTIDRKNLMFLIGGGGWADKTCINLIVNEKIERTATGPNIYPGGSEALSPAGWDVSELRGKSAHLEIVDHATGGWGHINVDQIVLTDRALPKSKNQIQTMKIEKRYLTLPSSNNAPLKRVTIKVDGKVIRDFDIRLATEKPEMRAVLDLKAWKGKTIEINANGARQTDAFSTKYNERLRPQFHFSTKVGWLNDPNGMVYAQGEYHLYYQLDPYNWGGENKHWGHAVSPDMVHWKELPIALYPHEYGDWVYSGSAIADIDNTGGFKTAKNDVIVAAYTSTGRGECIVYSNDRGRTFTELSGNPVVRHVGRDPRLFWYAPGKHWVMAVYDEQPTDPQQGISFYTSPDLRKWTFTSRIGGFFECPDMFQLGDKWVLTAASSEYMVGSFDGRVFTPETPKLPGYRGDAFYAAQTFSNMPDGRRVQIGWATIATPSMPFNQSMAFPCTLNLVNSRLHWWPIREIESLWGPALTVKDVKSDCLDITLSSGSSFTIKVRGMAVVYEATAHTVTCNARVNSLSSGTLRILADRTSLEIFGNQGELYMPMAGHFVAGAKALEVEGKVDSVTLHELKSAW